MINQEIKNQFRVAAHYDLAIKHLGTDDVILVAPSAVGYSLFFNGWYGALVDRKFYEQNPEKRIMSFPIKHSALVLIKVDESKKISPPRPYQKPWKRKSA